jgi:hypothetical protein
MFTTPNSSARDTYDDARHLNTAIGPGENQSCTDNGMEVRVSKVD